MSLFSVLFVFEHFGKISFRLAGAFHDPFECFAMICKPFTTVDTYIRNQSVRVGLAPKNKKSIRVGPCGPPHFMCHFFFLGLRFMCHSRI